MISKKRHFLHESKFVKGAIGAVALSLLLLAALLLAQRHWDSTVQWLCGFYCLAVGIFFLAQIAGFVLAQTYYSERMEAPKFTMLENEEAEWQL